MTTRILPAAEWGRLDGTELAGMVGQVDPARVTVHVVEHHGAIVGCWAVLTMVHVEGLWIAPEHRRRGVVGRRLWDALCAHAAREGVTSVLTAAAKPDVAALLEARGATALPPAYAMPIQSLRRKREPACPS